MDREKALELLKEFAVDHLVINSPCFPARDELAAKDPETLFELVYQHVKPLIEENSEQLFKNGHALGVLMLATKLGWINKNLQKIK